MCDTERKSWACRLRTTSLSALRRFGNRRMLLACGGQSRRRQPRDAPVTVRFFLNARCARAAGLKTGHYRATTDRRKTGQYAAAAIPSSFLLSHAKMEG